MRRRAAASACPRSTSRSMPGVSAARMPLRSTLRCIERRSALEAEIDGLAARPAMIAAESEALGAAIAGAAEACRRSADALAVGERQLREADGRLAPG